MTMIAEPNCSKRKCKHFLGVLSPSPENAVPYCAAFPKGIPFEVAYGTNLHHTAVPGDHGIRYEKDNK